MLDSKRAPYVQLRRREEMRRLIEESGATASLALRLGRNGSSKSGCCCPRAGRVHRSLHDSGEATVKRDCLDDEEGGLHGREGKEEERDVEDKSYKTDRHWIQTGMFCTLNYRILNTATGAIIGEGALDASDGDAVDFIAWNNYDGVNPSSLRVKDGTQFKRLSSDVRSAIDARSSYKSDAQMFRAGAAYIGEELAGRLLDTLTYYSPTAR